MTALIRFLVIGFIVLTVIYFGLLFYARSVRRSNLMKEWEEEGYTDNRDAYVREGMKQYEKSLQRKLLLGVYVVPVIVIGTIVYVIN